MRPVMIAMGSLILAGNLLLAFPVRQNTLAVRSAEQSEQEVRKGVMQALEDRGLETASAQQLVEEQYGAFDARLGVALAHLQILFPELERGTILKDMADRVLRREPIAFDDYDRLVGMLHRLKGPNLSPAHYARAHQCVLLNRHLLSA